MAASPNIDEFVERANAGGATEQFLVRFSATRGWPEKEAYEALVAHHERVIGLEVPRGGDTGTAAKTFSST